MASPKQAPGGPGGPGGLRGDLSDVEDEGGQGGPLYSTTIPSVDSAVESWDGSGLDNTFTSQGRGGRAGFMRKLDRRTI